MEMAMPDVLAEDDVLSFTPGSLMTTTPAGASAVDHPPSALAPPPQRDLGADIEEARARSRAATDRAEASINRETDRAERSQRAMAPLYDRALETVRSQKIPPVPQRAPMPAAPKRGNEPGADEQWLMVAGLLGALAGAFTRNHLTNGLAAMTGALQGYQEGSKQKFDQNLKIWEAETRNAIETNRGALEDYRATLENVKLTNDQMFKELEIKSMQYKDEAMAQAARTKNELSVAQLHDHQVNALTQLQDHSDRLRQQYGMFEERQKQQLLIAQMRAVGATNPEQMQDRIDAIGQYRMAPPAGKWGNAIMSEVAKQYPQYRQELWTAKLRSASVLGGAAANTELVLSRAGPVLENAVRAAAAVPATEFRRLNQLFQMGLHEISDPALADFKLANEELAWLFAAVQNPRTSQITVSAQTHARELISTADGPEAYHKVLENIARLANREMEVTKGMLEGKGVPNVVVPPVPEERRSSVPGMMKQITCQTGAGLEQALPGAQKAWEGAHPALPDWVPRMPEKWWESLGLFTQSGGSVREIIP